MMQLSIQQAYHSFKGYSAVIAGQFYIMKAGVSLAVHYFTTFTPKLGEFAFFFLHVTYGVMNVPEIQGTVQGSSS